jgi:hypothetical protein
VLKWLPEEWPEGILRVNPAAGGSAPYNFDTTPLCGWRWSIYGRWPGRLGESSQEPQVQCRHPGHPARLGGSRLAGYPLTGMSTGFDSLNVRWLFAVRSITSLLSGA